MKQFLLLFSIIYFVSVGAWAQQLPFRSVSMDWEAIQGAASYDVEFVGKTGFQKIFTVARPEWIGKLRPGDYKMRIRAKDRRKVPGDWSDYENITVQLEAVRWKTDQNKWQFDAKDPESHTVQLTWLPVPGAKGYKVHFENLDGTIKRTEDTKFTDLEATLGVAQSYKVSIEAYSANELKSESPATGEIAIIGPELKRPALQKPENKFVREILWKKDEKSLSTSVKVDWKDPETGKWKPMTQSVIDFESKFNLPAEWPGGQYRMTVVSQAPLRKISKASSIEFPVQSGDRSPAAEYVSLVRESIERTKGWFAIASYLVTGLSYSGVNSDNAAGNGLQVKFPQNFGGTGRLGLGFLSDETPFGFLGIIDLGGFIVRDKNPTFASSEANVVYRSELGGLGELRQHYGVFYKEIPEIIALNTEEIASISKISSLGPHAGLEYWVAISPKLGFQVNGHIYPNLVSIKTPNGNPIAISVSYQMGLLGSYRLGRRTTGLMGYAYRKDSQAYKSTSGKTNTIDLTGHYFNLFLEWSL